MAVPAGVPTFVKVLKVDELVVIALLCVNSELKLAIMVTVGPPFSLTVTVLTIDDSLSVDTCAPRMLLTRMVRRGAPPSRAMTPCPAAQQVEFRSL